MKKFLSRHLAALTLIGPLLLVALVGYLFVDSLFESGKTSQTLERSELLVISNALVHEVQKERGMTAGFLGSKGQQFSSELSSQRAKVDQAYRALKTFSEENMDDLAQSELIKPVTNEFNKLASIRSSVNQLSIQLPAALGYYTKINRFILDFNATVANRTDNPLFKQKYTVLYNVSMTKEGSGIERALLSNAFANKAFTPSVYNRWLSNTAGQSIYLNSALALAMEEFRPYLEQFLNGESNKSVQNYRAYAEQNAQGQLDRSAKDWFATSTARINDLKSAQDILFEEILDHAREEITLANTLMFAELILLAVVILLAASIFMMLSARSKQASAILEVMVDVSEEHDLTHKVDVITQDDLGEIAEALNKTLGSLGRDFKTFTDYASEIAAASSQAAASTSQSREAIMETRKSIRANRDLSEQLIASIEEDISSITRVNDTASLAREASESGANNVQTAVEGIKQTALEVNNVGEIINELASRVEEILSMVDVIRSVAEQTNLLALNAAIEAARAGEQGRGFAVVADEVRALAKRTQDSTEDISSVVDQLTASSERARQSIEQGNLRANDAVNLAEEINQTLAKVVGNMIELDEVAKAVTSSAHTQQSSVAQMNQEIQTIDSMSTQNAGRSEDVASAASQLSATADQMLHQVQKYRL